MVRAERALLDVLEIPMLIATAGASLGGMQGLDWAIRYPDDVRGVIAIGACARLDPQGMAWNAIARNAIMADPDWQGGDYYGTGRAPTRGLGVARQLGHVTYLSRQSLREKFGRRLQDRDDYSYSLHDADFAVESYLRHQAAKFIDRFDANTYLLLSRALTYFDLTRVGPAERAKASTLLISFTSDWLYPAEASRELNDLFTAAGKDVAWHNLETSYGHDSFLLEEAVQAPIISSFLERLHGR